MECVFYHNEKKNKYIYKMLKKTSEERSMAHGDKENSSQDFPSFANGSEASSLDNQSLQVSAVDPWCPEHHLHMACCLGVAENGLQEPRFQSTGWVCPGHRDTVDGLQCVYLSVSSLLCRAVMRTTRHDPCR
jgi:hypothetical protein